MKGKMIKKLHSCGIYRDPKTREKLERCKTSRVTQIYSKALDDCYEYLDIFDEDMMNK